MSGRCGGSDMEAQVLFAPMEGLTDRVFRRVHHESFSGVDAYFTPFVSLTQNLRFAPREARDLSPEANRGVPCVPQVLTRNADHFIWAAEQFAEMGYTEINLNAGCPSATVTAKRKGAGMLTDPDALDAFLESVCSRSPLPVSVKTRIGFASPEEWPRLLKIYARYPLCRLIIHPRTCRDRYDPDRIHPDCWREACRSFPGVLVRNGDLFGTADALAAFSSGSSLMIGRGMLADPALAREIKGGKKLTREELMAFHDRLTEALSEVYPPDTVFMKLRVFMKHLECCFEPSPKLDRKIRKARSLPELLEIDRILFDTCSFLSDPVYIPDEKRGLP